MDGDGNNEQFIDNVYKIKRWGDGEVEEIVDVDELDTEELRALLKKYIFFSDGFKSMVNSILSSKSESRKKAVTTVVLSVMSDVYNGLLKGFVVKTN